MRYRDVYYIIGTAYAGKSTMVKMLAEKFGGIACEENYHDILLDGLDSKEFPNLTYTRDLKDWSDFVRRTPEEYARWIFDVAKECEVLELRILDDLRQKTDKKIFVDTNISVETLREISDGEHVLVMLADPSISVNRFFERPDREKQFIYQLLLNEPDPDKAMANYREGLMLINSPERYQALENSGFPVICRDENRTVEQTLEMVRKIFALQTKC